MNKPVMIIGANALTPAAIEIFNSNKIEVFGVLDENTALHGKEFGEIAVLGSSKDAGFLKYIGQKAEVFIATDDNALRKSQVKMILEKRKVMPMNAIHQSAHISKSAIFGHGNFINMGVVIGADVEIGSHNLIHSGATIDHGCNLADFVQIGAGSSISNGVELKEGAFIGTGVIVVPGVSIGKNARVGAGSVVIKNVKDNETVFGNPAAPIKN